MSSTRWRVVGASVPGTSHLKKGQSCQDAHAFALWGDEVVLAAVADGASSAKLGEVGATVAVRAALDTLSTALNASGLPGINEESAWKQLLSEALSTARTAVEAVATERQVPMRDLATTLLLLVAAPGVAAAAQVGDGAVVVGDTDGSLRALTVPKSGEYINETTFLVSPSWLEDAQVVVSRDTAPFLCLFSDGLQMLALRMADRKPHAPFFDPLVRFVQNSGDEEEAVAKIRGFLCSPRVCERTDDDLTLLLAARIENPPVLRAATQI